MNNRIKQFLLYWMPLLINAGLLIYLVWQLNLIPYFQRQGGFQIFSILYALGGLVVAVSGFAVFVHSALNPGGSQRLFMLSLANIIFPTVLLLALFLFG